MHVEHSRAGELPASRWMLAIVPSLAAALVTGVRWCAVLFLLLLLLLPSHAWAAADCGFRAHRARGMAAAPQVMFPAVPEPGGPAEGLQCPGFLESQSCCEALPMQRVTALLQYSLEHDRGLIKGFERILPTVENTLEVVSSTASVANCASLAEAMLRPRLDAVRLMAERVTEAFETVEHLVLSGLCSYCFPEEEGASFRVTAQDGPAARRLSALSIQMEVTQDALRKSDAELLALDPDHRCIPAYLAGLLAGTSVGDYVSAGLKSRSGGEGADADEASVEAMSNGVEAVARQRRWPLDRRRLNAGFAQEALLHLDDDFFEVTARLLGSMIGPPSRLVHQAQLLAMTLEKKYHWSSIHPVARLFWGLAGEKESDNQAIARGESAVPPPWPFINGRPPEDETDDPGAAFGLVVLISNRTEEQLVDDLVDRLEGSRALFLEDTCGDALEALGSGCHGGGREQARCLRPVHATRIQELTASREATRRPRAAWRRHATTRSVAHSAWALATSQWGAACTAWVADLRPGHACPDTIPLAEAALAVPGARLRLVEHPQELFGLDVVAPAFQETSDAGASRPLSRISTGAAGLHRAWAPDTPLETRLAEYIEFHRRGVEALASSSTAEAPPVLLYSCQPFAQCGGHGDRLNGIATAFLLAVLTRRVFLLDSESPLPLQMFLAPRLIDWRVRGSMLATAGLRHHSYHDKRRQFEADIGALKAYDDPVLVLTMNYRMIRSLVEAPALRAEATELGLPEHSPPFLIAEIFDILFAPSPVLQHETRELRAALGGLEDGRFIAVHLRTGDVAWDPARHGKSELASFLDCARHAEAELGLPPGPETPWLLATDSSEVAAAAAGTGEARSGKLRVPGAGGRVHIDRSDLGETIEGAAANYAEWLLFGRAAGAVLSRSFFGETAAEVGRLRFAYFAPGGGCVRMELSSS